MAARMGVWCRCRRHDPGALHMVQNSTVPAPSGLVNTEDSPPAAAVLEQSSARPDLDPHRGHGR